MHWMNVGKSLVVVTLISANLIAATAFADPQRGGYGPGHHMGPGGGYGPGYGMGPGMMGGHDHGHHMGPGGGYGPGYGMGPGMMGGHDHGHHMGPGGGYGSGYGMGPGMMGGCAPGYGVLSQLNLTPEQWDKVNAIHDEFGKKQWELVGRMRDEAIKLSRLMTAEKRDRDAINDQYKKLQDVRQQRFEAHLDAREKIDGALTSEQKERLRRFAPWQGPHMQ